MSLTLDLLLESEVKERALEFKRGFEALPVHLRKQRKQAMVLDRQRIQWPYRKCSKKQIHSVNREAKKNTSQINYITLAH